MRVTNLIGSKGKPAANQFLLTDGSTEIFQSYKSIIAKIQNGKVTLDDHYWDYSKTTLKFLKIFLDTTESKKQIQKKIDLGEYLTADLN